MEVSFLFKINFAVLLVCFCESALSPEIRKAYQSFLSGDGLYVESDGIVILNATNIHTKLSNTKNAWVIEFYNSWCGHCHKFAPIWKKLAADYYEWRNVVQLGAIDCAHENHTSICRNYNIMAYPTLKFFSAHWQSSNSPMEVPRSFSEAEITKEVVKILQKEQNDGRGSDWPVIIPYRSYDTSNLGKATANIQYVFLIFADGNDSLAAEVILDLSNVKEIEIRGVVPENELLAKLLGVKTYPSLLVLENPKKEPKFMSPEDGSRESYRMEIKSFLKGKGIKVPEEPRKIDVISPNLVPSMNDLQKARNAFVQLAKIKELGDVVFLVDLEKTLKYSLEHEISSRREISGESFAALKAFLETISKYFPTSDSGIDVLQKLRDVVHGENETKGLKFKTFLRNISNGGLDSVFLTREDWLGCRGSEDYFRRYPCGLWTLFHYLTVNALRNSKLSHFNPLETLESILGYVTHFFGCTDCSQHFQEMARRRSMKTKVKTGEDAVLWLWSAHNEVNDRLAKDKSEDPEFPKIQFPSPLRCPYCRHSNNTWNEQVVLHYLISVYDKEKLNHMGSDTKLVILSNKSGVGQSNNHQKSELFEEDSPKKISKDFNVFDISLCVVLYILSAVICISVCLKFVLKKRHRRKSHPQDLMGRI